MDLNNLEELFVGYEGTVKSLEMLLHETHEEIKSGNASSAEDIDEVENYIEGVETSLELSMNPDSFDFDETVRVVFPMEVIQVHRFTLKTDQPLRAVFESLAELKGVNPEDLELFLRGNNRWVSPYDTLKSLDYDVTQVFNAVIRGSNFLQDANNGTGDLEVKCKLPERRHQPLSFKMHANQPMDILIKMCARELKCRESDFRLMLDGEVVLPCHTCSKLDITGGDLLEIHMKKL